jgi:hypothetical protein
MLYDRKCGEWVEPDGWITCAAGNRGMEDRVYQFDSSAALDNRFLWVELKVPSAEGWVQWGLKNGLDSRILAFVTVFPTRLYSFKSKTKEHAFSTPRTWEYASDLIRESCSTVEQ